jgi:2-phospho-L-lactate guanylyltransferase (CobY/MobA/RfbA family)
MTSHSEIDDDSLRHLAARVSKVVNGEDRQNTAAAFLATMLECVWQLKLSRAEVIAITEIFLSESEKDIK